MSRLSSSRSPRMGTLVMVVAMMMVGMMVEAVKNVEIVRMIDLTTAVTRMAVQIKTEDVSGSYVLSWNKALGERLSFMKVETPEGEPLPFERIGDKDGLVNYEVKVPSKSSSPRIHVSAVFTEAVKPFPEEISQTETQLVVFEDSHYAASIYPTDSQTTSIRLSSKNVESYSKLSPSSLSGNIITAGPYKDVPAKSFSAFRVHYENMEPFAVAAVAIREIEVSHWGNVAHEEYYEVRHAGAKLKGGFSRHDYQQYHRAGASFRTLGARLPRGAHSIYYRDQIGNISSSQVRFTLSAVELNVDLRFPLFGGWKTVFYQGYNVPIQELVTKSGGSRHTLTVPFSIPYPDLWTRDLTVKVILPEHATNVHVDVPFDVEESRTSRLTYLDTSLSGGRPVLILKKTNVVTEHDQDLVITYDFNQTSMLWEPMYVVAAFLAFYVLCMVAVRVDLRIGHAAAQQHQKEKSL